MNPIIALGHTRSLEAADLPPLPARLEPVAKSLDESKIDWSSGPALLKSLLRLNKRGWLLSLVYYGGFALFSLCGPVLVNIFVTRLESGIHTSSDLLESVIYALCVGLTGLLGGLCIQHYFHANICRIQMIINVVNTKIFRHALVLSKEAREKIPVGDIVNHLSTDTDAVAEVNGAVSDFLYCVTMISGAIGLLFYYIGSTAWVAVALLALLVPVTRKVGREFTRNDEVLMKHRDERVSLMAQILSAVRLVKYFVWEKSVSEEVAQVRAKELAARRRIARAELMVTLLYVSVGTFVLFAVLAVYAWRGGQLAPALVFTCVSLFSLLEDPFAFLTRTISQLINAKVGGERIAKFLAQKATLTSTGSSVHSSQTVGVSMKDVSVHLGEARFPSLIGVNMTLMPGQSLAVVGPVGSGKTTFIHSLLGEVERSSGEISFFTVTGERGHTARIGYVPQETYILNGTLRENLTFGNEGVSEEQVGRALEISGLISDVQRMPGGLKTEIGEKGVNLSGGQKQRLSLARSFLHKPQLVVLDDPLSAVDPAMEDHLANHLIFGEWKNVTRVAITHRLTHLQRFDKIAFLDRGQLRGFGSFAELSENCPAFRAYLEEYARSHAVPAGMARVNEEVKTVVSTEASRITEDEDREFGAVRGGVYWDYVLSLGGENKRWRPYMLTLLFAAAASGTAFPLLQKAWLAYAAGKFEALTVIYVYGGLGLLVLAAALCADLFWLKRGLAAGRNIHEQMLKSILGATVRFFDSTPMGRILQRFSRDMEAIDIQLQWSFEHSMKSFAQVIVTLTLIVVTLPWVALVIAPVLLIYYRVQKLYRSSAREAKRLDSLGRSPRYAHFKETLQGLVVIRAFGKTDWFLEEFYKRLSHSQRMFHGHFMINRWFSSRIPLVGGLVSMLTALAVVLSVRSGTLSPGLGGLLTVYSLSFWGVLNWGIRIWAEVEARMTSMERVKFYSRLPQEPSVTQDGVVPEAWPVRGEVRFENVVLRYAPHLPEVLKGLSFNISAGEKAGIIGRTGSGKSTLIQALYRFTELTAGRILIDGVDIATVPLARLRKVLAIIPQDPTLFMGTIRSNLDRYGEFSEAELWSVLERTNLAEAVRAMPLGLESRLHENGSNLSQGQRQLMCLARALLMKAKVIILDEATASVDVQTDAQVQRIVRESCKGVTMLIIAHRLGTVRDCDQILEISEGRLKRGFTLGESVASAPAPA